MTPTPAPMRLQALAEVGTLALRWLTSFDPFGPFGTRTDTRTR